MRFLTWLQPLESLARHGRTKGARRRSSPTRSAAARLTVEILEDRRLLSVSPMVPYAVGDNPQAVATGYFNNDLVLDLVVANSASNTVSILLGNSDGTFTKTAIDPSTGSSPRSVAVGDFNKDGNLDVVTANSSNLSVLLGKGDGTFQPASTISLPTGLISPANASPLSVAVGDLNNDGKMDLVATSTYIYTYFNAFTGNSYSTLEGRVDVLLGDGAGNFAPPPSALFPFYSRANTIPTSLALTDVDGDGKLDVMVGNTNGINTVTVLPGNGDGTLLPRQNEYGTGTSPVSLAVGDLNGDGKLDLVTANNGSNDVSVLLGNGDATFQAAVSVTAGTNPTAVAIGDLNGDGRADLVVNNQTSNNVTVLLGFGDGTFVKDADYGAGTSPAAVAMGDFNGDGKLDLAVASAGDDSASVLLNAADWGVLARITGPTVGARHQTLTFTLEAIGLPAGTGFTFNIDWDGNGIVDQIVSNVVSGTTVTHAFATAGNTTSKMTTTGPANNPSAVATHDTNVLAVSVAIGADPGDATKQALLIDGTANAETIVISPGTGNGVLVSIDGTSVGNIVPTGASPFSKIIVHAGGGDDTVQITGNLSLQAMLFGDAGADTLDASGSTAANVLVGGAGADNLTGGSGNDLLIGGAGADTLLGNARDDILIGGTTDFDTNQAALSAILAEWSQTGVLYSTRVNHLQGGKGKNSGGGLNGSFFLTSATMHDDGAIDTLTGDGGTDWFFAKTRGTFKDITDKARGRPSRVCNGSGNPESQGCQRVQQTHRLATLFRRVEPARR